MSRPRLFMPVYGHLAYDARVQRAASALADLADVTVYATGAPSPAPAGYAVAVAPLPAGAEPGPRLFAAFCRHMVAAARAARPQVVYAHDYFLALPGWLAARLAGARFVYDAHELMVPGHGFRLGRRARAFYLAERAVVGRADLVLAATPERAAEMQRHYRLAALPVHVRNVDRLPERAPDPARAAARHPDLAARLGGAFTLIYQGVLLPERRLDLFVRAMPRLPDDVRLLLVGGGAEAPRLAALVAELGLADRVILPGRVPHDDLHDILAFGNVGLVCYAADSANTLYPAPNKVFEYAHAGLPILSTAQPPLVDLVERSGIGELFRYVRAGDDEAVAIDGIVAGVARLRADPGRYRAGQAAFLARHGWAVERERLRAAMAPLLGAG